MAQKVPVYSSSSAHGNPQRGAGAITFTRSWRTIMKRFTLFLSVAALAVSLTTSAEAADSYYGHGGIGHAAPGYGYTSSSYGYPAYGHPSQRGYVGHGYSAPAKGHGAVQHGYVDRGYAGHGYAGGNPGGYGYPSFGHGGGVRVSTPHIGLRIGH
jgi:hypothetical protein